MHRIKFRGTLKAAEEDMDVFKRVEKEINPILKQACEEIAKHNRLARVTREELISEMLITGWFHDKKS